MKRYFNKVTNKTTKQKIYADEEGTEHTAGGWKKWADLNGYVAENSIQNRSGNFIIYDPLHNRTVKVLRNV